MPALASTSTVTTGAGRGPAGTLARLERAPAARARRASTRHSGAALPLVRASHPRADLTIISGPTRSRNLRTGGRCASPGDHAPLAVTTILAELGMTPETLAAAGSLHDVVEDTDYPLAEIEREFGPDVAHMVNGVTKLDKVKLGEAAAQAETLRKMVVAMAGDIRVLVIKLADRLHNARTGNTSVRRRRRPTKPSTSIAPLAHRLG